MKTAMIFDIQRASTVDGPGLRTTVFFKGCNLRCAWCHNPESQSAQKQLLFYADKCAHCGACLRVCPNRLQSCDLCGRCETVCPHDARSLCGREYGVEEVMRKILADRLFYQTGGGGATFSGGECMLQLDFLKELLSECRKNGVHTAVDTAGNVPYRSFEEILPLVDLFLYDVKCMDDDRHRQYVGVGNARILDNLVALLRSGARVWVRVPVVPGVNDSVEEMERLRVLLEENGGPERVELLPYHRMGERKSLALGSEPISFEVPSSEKMRSLRNVMRAWSAEPLSSERS